MTEDRAQFIEDATAARLREAGRLVVGANTYGSPHVWWWGEDARLEIGRYCSFAVDVTFILGGNHRLDWVTTYPFPAFADWPQAHPIRGHPSTKGDIRIGNDVWIGHDATVLSGVTVGDGAVIGAGAVVSRDVPPYAVASGNPARVMRTRFDPDVVAALLRIRWWDWPEERVRAELRSLLSIEVGQFARQFDPQAAADAPARRLAGAPRRCGALCCARPGSDRVEKSVMDTRRRLYWDMLDFASGHGLEVGPLHRAMVHRNEGDVSYVDVTDRERLLEHYAGDPNVPPETIPEIDYFLIDKDGETHSFVDAVKAGAPFDWVMASHVIEHVPNVIGWLAELAEVVVDGGALVLAVPDRRYCFDVHRPPTTVGQLLAAHHADHRRPGVAAVYDYFSGSVDNDVQSLWRGDLPTWDRRIHSLDEALAKVGDTLDGTYVDSHVWLFSPQSFLRQMNELRTIGMSSWFVERLEPTPHHDLEFRVVMRRLPRGCDTTEPLADEVLAEGDLPDHLPDEAASRARIAELEIDKRRLERRTERLEQRLRQKSRRLKRLRTRVGEQDGGRSVAQPASAGAWVPAIGRRLGRLGRTALRRARRRPGTR